MEGEPHGDIDNEGCGHGDENFLHEQANEEGDWAVQAVLHLARQDRFGEDDGGHVRRRAKGLGYGVLSELACEHEIWVELVRTVVHTQKNMIAVILVTADGLTTDAMNQKVDPMMTWRPSECV